MKSKMKNKKIYSLFILGFLLLGFSFFINNVSALGTCDVSDCFDSNNYPDCDSFRWVGNQTFNKTISSTCFAIRGKSFDMSGATFNLITSFVSDAVVVYLNSGEIKNGIINFIWVGSNDWGRMLINSPCTACISYLKNMIIEGNGGLSYYWDGYYNIIDLVGNGKFYFENDIFKNNISADRHTVTLMVDGNGSIELRNCSIKNYVQPPGSPYYGILINQNTTPAITLYNTEILSHSYNLYLEGQQNIQIVNKARFCNAYVTDVYSASSTPSTISGGKVYFDTSVNATIPNNATCYEFSGWGYEGNETNHQCSQNLGSLNAVGLYDFQLMSVKAMQGGTVQKYAVKVKIQNESLYNSLNIATNKVCLKKLGSSFEVCKNATYYNNMYDAMYSNLATANYSDLIQFNSVSSLGIVGGITDFIFGQGITSGFYRDIIADTYCKEYNQNCGLLGCTCKGFAYEFPVSELESGDYAIYFELYNSSNCLFQLYNGQVTLNGGMPDVTEYIKQAGLTETPTTSKDETVIVQKKIYNNAKFLNISSGDNCNLTLYTYGAEVLKSSDVIFYLTANTTTNRYNEGDVIEMKQGIYDQTNHYYYATFNLCSPLYYNVSSVGTFVKIKDTALNKFVDVSNNGYIITVNKTTGETGTPQNFYYYIDNSTKIYYETNSTPATSTVVNDTYFKTPQETVNYWYYLFLGMIIFAVIYAIYVLFSSSKRTYYK